MLFPLIFFFFVWKILDILKFSKEKTSALFGLNFINGREAKFVTENGGILLLENKANDRDRDYSFK